MGRGWLRLTSRPPAVPLPLIRSRSHCGLGPAARRASGRSRLIGDRRAEHAPSRTLGHDLEALATTLLRAEALGSSFIEGLRASNKRLALAAYEPVAADPTARAVLGNVRAMEHAIAIGTEERRFRLKDLLDIHRTLLEGTTEERFAGAVRTEQNWIGGRGTSPHDAAFVPPRPIASRHYSTTSSTSSTSTTSLRSRRRRSHMPNSRPSIPSATATAARGRCLIHVILRRRSVTTQLVPPISVVLAAHARRYIAGLTDFHEGRADDSDRQLRRRGRSGCSEHRASSDADRRPARGAHRRAGSPRTDSVARRIILGLPQQPIVSAEIAARVYAVTPTAHALRSTAFSKPTYSYRLALVADVIASGSAMNSSKSSTRSNTTWVRTTQSRSGGLQHRQLDHPPGERRHTTRLDLAGLRTSEHSRPPYTPPSRVTAVPSAGHQSRAMDHDEQNSLETTPARPNSEPRTPTSPEGATCRQADRPRRAAEHDEAPAGCRHGSCRNHPRLPRPSWATRDTSRHRYRGRHALPTSEQS